ncbi:MAG: sensor histidine kinase, partial [Chitinophagales bacterium]
MLKLLSKLIPEPIPEKYKEEFNQFILHQNLRNTVLFSWLMVGLHVLFLLTDFFQYTSGGWDKNPAYYHIVFCFHLIVYPVFGSVLVIAKLFRKQIEALPSNISENIVMAYIMVTACWLVSVAAHDQIIHGKIPLYIVYTLMSAIVFTLDKNRILFAQLFGYGLLVIGIYFLQPNTQKMIGVLINGAGFATIGYFVGLYYYRKRGIGYMREQLLKEKTRELEEMNDKWKKANKELIEVNGELKTFVYAVSHDLKAPLRMVNSFTSLLERSLNGSIKPEAKEYMGYISNGAKRMNVLLDDLRDYAMVNKGDLVTQPVDLNLVIRQVKQNLLVNIEESEATIEVKSLPTVKAV